MSCRLLQLGERAELAKSRERGLLERLGLLGRDVEEVRRLLARVLLPVDAVAKRDHLPLRRWKRIEQVVETRARQASVDPLVRAARPCIDDLDRKLAAIGVRPLERDEPHGGAQGPLDLRWRERRRRGDLGERRRSLELTRKRLLHALHSPASLADVGRHPNGLRLGRARPIERLADPQDRVARKLVAAPPVESLARPDQTERSLLDEVERGTPCADSAVPPIPPGGDWPRSVVPSPGHPPFDPLGEGHFLRAREQAVTTDLTQVEGERVGGDRLGLTGSLRRAAERGG